MQRQITIQLLTGSIKNNVWYIHHGLDCNTLGVWLPHLHLHFRSMSIIHLIYAFVLLET
jgi:hypothetical protein